MSEKEKEREEEREIVDHWSHEHPLTFVETRRDVKCYGCRRYFSRGERGYGCSKKSCGYEKLLHEECGRVPRKIRHPLHPQHTLIHLPIKDPVSPNVDVCIICTYHMFDIGYKCTSSECRFKLHMRCAQNSGVMEDAADDKDDDDGSRSRSMRHPSHPRHELRMFGKRSSFKCDACGTVREGKSYICTVCEYWIHERCASLPRTFEREDHHHSLSLSFHVPPQYLKFDYKCDVCNKYLLPTYWIYHCQLCRYAVHLKCAFNKSPHATINITNEKDIIRLPINDASEELIRPLVMRGGGAVAAIPHDDDDDDEMANNVKYYKFLHHEHQLTLISSSSHQHHQEEEEGEEEEDDDWGKRPELICDGCITPIFSSSSSSEDKCYNYMSCSECKYNLHLACFNLPPRLPSLPLHHQPLHDLILQSCDITKPWAEQYCGICSSYFNGLFYSCTYPYCWFKADIKCASLPKTICHAAHPQHLLNYVRAVDIIHSSLRFSCAADGHAVLGNCYSCNSCDFFVHVGCAVLPAAATSRRWDKHHPLPLTYDANLNHPGDFCCDQCEEEMNPKSWMYHCRHCDLSFHPKCFKTTSGVCRNIRLGQEYVNAAIHPHTLTYQLLTTKRRCDVCGDDRYNRLGFHCASCNFFICTYYVHKKLLEDDRQH